MKDCIPHTIFYSLCVHSVNNTEKYSEENMTVCVLFWPIILFTALTDIIFHYRNSSLYCSPLDPQFLLSFSMPFIVILVLS